MHNASRFLTPRAGAALALAAFALLLLSCAPKGEWPPAAPADLGDTFYAARATAAGAELVAVTAAGVKPLGVPCDGESQVAVSPDGAFLFYGADSALHQYELKTGRDRVVLSFPAGVAREMGTEGEQKDKVLSWRCGFRFRDVVFAPDGRLAVLAEPASCPQAETRPEDYTAAERAAWKPRAAFAADAGAYLVFPGGKPEYVGPTRALYGFADDKTLVLENKLTAASYELAHGDVRPFLAKDAHEVGWLPVGVVAPGRAVLVGAKARERSLKDIMNRVYVVEGSRGKDKPLVAIKTREPATRAALSPDGRYLAVETTPQVLGPAKIFIVDLKSRRFRLLAVGARLFRFARGSRAVYYLGGEGRAGDLFLAGLDGTSRRLTTSGDVLPLP